MEELLKPLDGVILNFDAKAVHTMNIALALIMFGVALGIKFKDFSGIFKSPKQVIVGIVSQFIALPALTFLLVILIKPSPTVALGMILVASCPGGNISNFMTALSKGNTALSITLTAFSTLSATIMTPLNFSFWGHQYLNFYNKANASGLLQPIDIEFSQMLQTVFILLGIPLILGILFSHYLPKATSKIIKPLKIASVLIFIGFVVIAFAKNIDHFLTHIHYIFIIVLIHNALALFTGFSLSTLMGLTRPVRRSITIETGIQNSGLALALIFNPKIFPPELQLGGMAIVAAWWGIWHIISGLSLAFIWTRRDVKDEPARWSAKTQTTSIENG